MVATTVICSPGFGEAGSTVMVTLRSRFSPDQDDLGGRVVLVVLVDEPEAGAIEVVDGAAAVGAALVRPIVVVGTAVDGKRVELVTVVEAAAVGTFSAATVPSSRAAAPTLPPAATDVEPGGSTEYAASAAAVRSTTTHVARARSTTVPPARPMARASARSLAGLSES